MRVTSPPSHRHAAHRLPQLPRGRPGVLLGAAAVMAALSLLFGADTPGAGIRGDLAAGAEALRALPQTASDAAVHQAMREAFLGRAISIDSAAYPVAVAVTLRGVDRRSCNAAATGARRLEGSVVVELVGYRSPADCGPANDMTWRFMP